MKNFCEQLQVTVVPFISPRPQESGLFKIRIQVTIDGDVLYVHRKYLPEDFLRDRLSQIFAEAEAEMRRRLRTHPRSGRGTR